MIRRRLPKQGYDYAIIKKLGKMVGHLCKTKYPRIEV
jgi:hypothetical protein